MNKKTLLHPKIFISAFSHDQKAIKFLLESVISAYNFLFPFPLNINSIEVYESGIVRSDGYPDQSIIVFGEDDNGNLYDFDLVIADEINLTKQAHVHNNHLSSSGRYSENNNVKKYVYLFTPKTLPEFDLPLAIVKWSLLETDEILENANHTLIINCERNTRMYSRFHDIIHDLRQHNPDEMYTSELRKAYIEVSDI